MGANSMPARVETAGNLTPPGTERQTKGNQEKGIEMTTYRHVEVSFGTARAKAVWINPG